MSERHSGTQADLFAKYFPGEPWTIVFEPTEQQAAAITSMVTARADDDRTTLLQMLGVIPSEGVFNPTARDAWTRRPMPPISKEAAAQDTHCKNGHARELFTYINREGVKRCRQCRRVSEKNRRAVKAGV